MDRITRRLFNRLNRLHKRQIPLTSEERQNLINSEGLYKLITNHNKRVDGIVNELIARK